MKTTNSNIGKLTLYMTNREKKKDFHTTLTYKDVNSLEEAVETLNTLFDKNIQTKEGKTFYEGINKVFYSGKCIVRDGKLLV